MRLFTISLDEFKIAEERLNETEELRIEAAKAREQKKFDKKKLFIILISCLNHPRLIGLNPA